MPFTMGPLARRKDEDADRVGLAPIRAPARN